MVAVEEVESIATDQPTLTRYLALQRRMLEANGHTLDVGPVLAEAARASGTILQNQVVTVSPSVSAAGQMFAMNFVSWRTQPTVEQLASDRELNAIAEGLAALSAHHDADASITWELREVVIGGRDAI